MFKLNQKNIFKKIFAGLNKKVSYLHSQKGSNLNARLKIFIKKYLPP